jgi:hypothetical protein
MTSLTKATMFLVALEVVCVAIVSSPLRAHVAAIAGQTQLTSGTAIGAPASNLIAALVIGAEMAAVTLLPTAIIACILHACILQGAKFRAPRLERAWGPSKELEKSRRLTDD